MDCWRFRSAGDSSTRRRRPNMLGIDHRAGHHRTGGASYRGKPEEGHRLPGIPEIACGQAQRPGTVLLLEANPCLAREAVVFVIGRELAIGLNETLHGREGFGLLGIAGGDVDDPAHRVADIARRVRAIDDVELFDFARSYHAPLGREREAVAKEVRNDEPIDHCQRAGTLRRMRAAEAWHPVAVPGVALAHEEIGRVLDQVFCVESIDHIKLLSTQTDSKAARCDFDGRIFLPDDEDRIFGCKSVSGVGSIVSVRSKRRRGEAQRKAERNQGTLHCK